MPSSKQTTTVFEGKTATYTSDVFEANRDIITAQAVGTLGTGDSVAIQVSLQDEPSTATFETVHTFDDSSTTKVANIQVGEGTFYRAVFTSANSNSTSLYIK